MQRMLNDPPAAPLDYATEPLPRGNDWILRIVAFLLAAAGMAMNGMIIAATIDSIRSRDYVLLWASQAALILSAGFGVGLAVIFCIAAAEFISGPARAAAKLAWYARMKPIGVIATCSAFIWLAWEHSRYKVAMGRSGDPSLILSFIVLACSAPCAVIPILWAKTMLAVVDRNLDNSPK